MRDKKHRILSTFVLIMAIILAFYMFNMLSRARSMEISALIAFSAGILVVVLYQLINFKNLRHKVTKVNALTQVWLGLLFVVASIFVLVLNTAGIEFATAMMWMSGFVIALLFLSIKHFDEFLEDKIATKQ